MSDKRGDFSKKDVTYKFYKKGYSSTKAKYLSAGQDTTLSIDINGSVIGNAIANAIYNKPGANIHLTGMGDSNFGLSANISAKTDASRLFDLKNIIAVFNHSYNVSGTGFVSSYAAYLFNYKIMRDVTAGTIALYYKGNAMASATMSSSYNWIRLRERNGTVYVDRSSDGATWNNWASRAVTTNDTLVGVLRADTSLGAAGTGNASVTIGSIDISDVSGNLLAVENKKVLTPLQFTKNINTPAVSTTLEINHDPRNLPDNSSVLKQLAVGRITNHSINPSFEIGSGTIEVRRNHVLNPRMSGSGTAATSWFNYSGGTVTGTRSVSGNIQTITQSTGAGRIGVACTVNGLLPQINAGRAITLSIDVKSLSLGTGTALMYAEASGGGGFPNNEKTITSTGRQYLKFQTTETGKVSFSLYVWVQGGTGTISFTDVMAEDIDAELPYFDGTTNAGFDTASLTPAWTGTANNSASILNGTAPAGGFRYNAAIQPAMWLSSDNPKLGSKFMRVLMKHSSASTISVADTLGVASGEERTYIGNYRANRIQTVQPRWNSSTGGGAGSEPVGGTFTLSTNWSELRRTGTTTHNNASLDFLMSNAQAGDIIDIDNHMVVEGNYTGDYFDGNTSSMAGRNEDNTSYIDPSVYRYGAENSHLLLGNTIEATVSHRPTNVTPQDVSLLKFSGFIDTINRDYNKNTISLTAISHGELLSNTVIGYADSIVTSDMLTQKLSNLTEGVLSRRQTFTPTSSIKISGAKVRLSYSAGGSAQIIIGRGNTVLASSKTMSWGASLAAGVYNFPLLAPFYPQPGTTYWLRVNGLVNWGYYNSNVYSGGSRQTVDPSGLWVDTATDAYFELYTTNPSVAYEYSGTISGLVDRVFAEVGKNYGLIYKGSVTNPSYNISIKAAADTGLSLLESALKMSPSGYWSDIDVGTGAYTLKPYPTVVDHTFILGRDITEFNLSESISGIINDLVFVGADIDDLQNKLAIRTQDRTSMGVYKLGLGLESNGKVSRYDSAQLLSNYEITNNNKPRQSSSISIPASKYDIETIKVGQLIKILNADSELLAGGLMIASLNYTPSGVTLSLDSAPQAINATVDKIRRDLNNSETSGVTSLI